LAATERPARSLQGNDAELDMTLKRDNEEERMTRIESVLARLGEGRADSQRIQEHARRGLSELHVPKGRRVTLVESIHAMLKRKSVRKKPPTNNKRSR
jgi:hypothetical protein